MNRPIPQEEGLPRNSQHADNPPSRGDRCSSSRTGMRNSSKSRAAMVESLKQSQGKLNTSTKLKKTASVPRRASGCAYAQACSLEISVNLSQGQGLAAKDCFNILKGENTSSDPYAIVSILTANSELEIGRTKTCLATLNPFWNQTLVGSWPPGTFATENFILQITIMDFDLCKADDLMGVVKIPLKVETATKDKQWIEVPKSSAKGARGKIELSVSTKAHYFEGSFHVPQGMDEDVNLMTGAANLMMGLGTAAANTLIDGSTAAANTLAAAAGMEFEESSSEEEEQEKEDEGEYELIFGPERPVLQLKVAVHQGDGLVAKDRNILGQFAFSDPYVILEAWPKGMPSHEEARSLNEKQQERLYPRIDLGRSTCVRKNLSPVWEFVMDPYSIPMSKVDLEEAQLRLRIMDDDFGMGADDPMGNIDIYLQPTKHLQVTKKWYHVSVTSCSRASGRVQVTLDSHPTTEREVIGRRLIAKEAAAPKQQMAEPQKAKTTTKALTPVSPTAIKEKVQEKEEEDEDEDDEEDEDDDIIEDLAMSASVPARFSHSMRDSSSATDRLRLHRSNRRSNRSKMSSSMREVGSSTKPMSGSSMRDVGKMSSSMRDVGGSSSRRRRSEQPTASTNNSPRSDPQKARSSRMSSSRSSRLHHGHRQSSDREVGAGAATSSRGLKGQRSKSLRESKRENGRRRESRRTKGEHPTTTDKEASTRSRSKSGRKSPVGAGEGEVSTRSRSIRERRSRRPSDVEGSTRSRSNRGESTRTEEKKQRQRGKSTRDVGRRSTGHREKEGSRRIRSESVPVQKRESKRHSRSSKNHHGMSESSRVMGESTRKEASRKSTRGQRKSHAERSSRSRPDGGEREARDPHQRRAKSMGGSQRQKSERKRDGQHPRKESPNDEDPAQVAPVQEMLPEDPPSPSKDYHGILNGFGAFSSKSKKEPKKEEQPTSDATEDRPSGTNYGSMLKGFGAITQSMNKNRSK